MKLAKDAGFEGIELALCSDGEISMTSSDEELLSIRAYADQLGIKIPSLSSGLCWTDSLTADDPEERQRAFDMVVRQLYCAKMIGAETILVIPGCVNAEFAAPGRVEDYAQTYDTALESLEAVKGHAAACQVEIALENVWNKFLLSPVEMRDFIDKLDSPWVGSYFDVGNAVANGYPEHWIRVLGQRIKKVHFKDYRAAAGGLHGFVDMLAGDVNYPEVMKALGEVGYDGWVTAEMSAYKHYPETILYTTSIAMDKILGRN
jgi:hexulose-6-phosphate isomerase